VAIEKEKVEKFAQHLLDTIRGGRMPEIPEGAERDTGTLARCAQPKSKLLKQARPVNLVDASVEQLGGQ
jgi:hypothetical protein